MNISGYCHQQQLKSFVFSRNVISSFLYPHSTIRFARKALIPFDQKPAGTGLCEICTKWQDAEIIPGVSLTNQTIISHRS